MSQLTSICCRFVEIDAVVEIENAQVPTGYFRNLARAINDAHVYDGLIVSYLGEADYPDLAAEIADLFLRLEGTERVVCMGAFGEEIYLSVRATSDQADAEQMAKAIVGEDGTAGGRSTLAGGQVLLNGREPEAVANILSQRALAYLELPEDVAGKPLVT
jgi:nanoRNase/pAp phosphatase (c-di-AMP/oligoRNAs hydrolase)